MKFILIEKREEVPGVESFTFQPSEPLIWKAGQYAHYRLPHEPSDDRGNERWFTISSAPYEGLPAITTRFAVERGSSFKKALQKLEVGETIESDYVEGDFTIDDAAQEYVFIAGGIGITPFHSILKQAQHEGAKLRVTLIYANRDENAVFKSELSTWAQNNPDLVIHYLTDSQRVDEECIRSYVNDLQNPLFYLSGPEPMVNGLHDLIQKMGVPKEHIKLDDFPGYTAI